MTPKISDLVLFANALHHDYVTPRLDGGWCVRPYSIYHNVTCFVFYGGEEDPRIQARLFRVDQPGWKYVSRKREGVLFTCRSVYAER